MGVFATDKNLITYIYNSESVLGKKVLGYVNSIKEDCQVINIAEDSLPDTSWTEIATMAQKNLGELFSPEHPSNDSIDDDADFDTDGWLKIIKKNPTLLQKPLLIKGDVANQIHSRADIAQYFGVDSAGLEKHFDDENPTTSSQTENETFVPKRSDDSHA